MLTKAKTAKTLSWVELERKSLFEWNGRGMKISCVADIELKFGIHVIYHKIYSSSHLNSVSCEAIDLTLQGGKEQHVLQPCQVNVEPIQQKDGEH